MSLLSIGVTGINAAQLGLMTTGNNISNVNTDGYSRQRISQSTNLSIGTGAGYIGMGTNVSTISRVYNSVLTNQINQSQAQVSQLTTYYDNVSQIDNMLADESAGLSSTMLEFFSGLQTVASDTTLISSRDTLVSDAKALSSRVNSLNNQLSALYSSVNTQLDSTVSSINSYASQIASLNQRIMEAQAATNQPPNDLLDQRDTLVTELNTLVGVTTVEESNGSLSVFIGNGQQLVVGLRTNQLAVQASSADPTRMAVGLVNAGGVQELSDSMITGGALGGLLSFRSQSLDSAANSLGQVAASLALTVNAQLSLGQDLLGNSAGDTDFVSDFFTISDPLVWANSLNQGTATVAASLVNPPPMSLNGNTYAMAYDSATSTYTVTRKSDGTEWTATGTEALNDVMQQVYNATGDTLDLASANYTTNLTGSDYRVSFDGTNYTVTRLSDNKKWTDADPIALSSTIADSEGFSFDVTGAMANGDSFTIQPTRDIGRNFGVNASIAADSRLIAAGQAVRTSAGSANSGSGVISAGSVSPGYTVPTTDIGITYNSGNLDFTNLAAGAMVTVTNSSGTTTYTMPASVPYTSPSSTYTVGGFTFSLSGVPKDNDTFTLSANAGGTSDARNANLLAKLQTQGGMAGGTATFQDSYAQLVSKVGNKTREAEVNLEAQQSLLDQANSARESVSGVNLDEEAANLLKYQQAYQASAKMMTIASELFDTVLSIGY